MEVGGGEAGGKVWATKAHVQISSSGILEQAHGGTCPRRLPFPPELAAPARPQQPLVPAGASRRAAVAPTVTSATAASVRAPVQLCACAGQRAETQALRLAALPGTATLSRVPERGVMGQASCCVARGDASPAPGTQGRPCAAPRPRLGLFGRGAPQLPQPLSCLVSSRSPELLLSNRVKVTRCQRTKDSHLLLFSDAIAIATFK